MIILIKITFCLGLILQVIFFQKSNPIRNLILIRNFDHIIKSYLRTDYYSGVPRSSLGRASSRWMRTRVGHVRIAGGQWAASGDLHVDIAELVSWSNASSEGPRLREAYYECARLITMESRLFLDLSLARAAHRRL